MSGIGTVIVIAAVMALVLSGVIYVAYIYNLNHIKSRTVGDGQHGTAQFIRANLCRTAAIRRCIRDLIRTGIMNCSIPADMLPVYLLISLITFIPFSLK